MECFNRCLMSINYCCQYLCSDKPKISKIVDSLSLKVTTAKFPDPKTHLQAILHQWLPLSASILDLVCSYLPSPLEMSEERVKNLMCSGFRKFEAYPEETQKLKEGMLSYKYSASLLDPLLVWFWFTVVVTEIQVSILYLL